MTIKEHLSAWRRELEPKTSSRRPGPGRKPGPYKWYEIQDNTAYFDEFARPKVIWAKTAYEPQFAYDTSGAYLANTVHFIPEAPLWLANVLSSSLFEALYVFKTPLLRGGYIELTPERIAPLPVVVPGRELMASLSRDLSREEADQLTARLYGIDEADMQLIIRALKDRREFRPLNNSNLDEAE